MKKYLAFFLFFWPILFVVGLLFSSNSSICCMYGATRVYGWPKPLIALTKGTDTYDEAKQVYLMPAVVLLAEGWHFVPVSSLTEDENVPTLSSLLLTIIESALGAFVISWFLSMIKEKPETNQKSKKLPKSRSAKGSS